MSKVISSVAFLVFVVFAANSSQAQPPESSQAQSVEAFETLLEYRLFDPTQQVSSSSTLSSFSLIAGQEGGSAVLSFRRDLYGDAAWLLKLSAPWNKGPLGTTIFSNEGIASSFQVELGLTFSNKEDEAVRLARAAPAVTGFGEARQSLANRQVSLARLLYSAAITGTIGEQSFEYLPDDNADSVKEKEYPWKLTAGFSGQPLGAKYLVSITAEYQEGHKASPLATVCTPAEDRQAEFCKEIPLQGPVSRKSATLATEYRRWLADDAAISFRAAHDFENDITSLGLPIYFISGPEKKDSTSGLNGGVILTWNSEDEEVTPGVFVGTTFDAW